MPAGVTSLRSTYFRLQRRWQYSGRRRIAYATWLARHLPWSLWCRLCAWNARGVVAEIARRSGRPLTFVQIGSCDGKANDPLHQVVRSCQWSGILVEPMPGLFEQLVANYDGVSGLRFFQVAIGSAEGIMTMYSVDPRPEDPDWVVQLSSFDRDVVMSHSYALPELETRIFTVEVEARTVASLIAEAGLTKVDLLHIDAEGFDDQIIRDLPLTASWAPQFLIFEKKHLGRTRYSDLRRLLRRTGYKVVNLWPDELAYRDPPDGRLLPAGF
jgi:FkbM family methyltransferase